MSLSYILSDLERVFQILFLPYLTLWRLPKPSRYCYLFVYNEPSEPQIFQLIVKATRLDWNLGYLSNPGLGRDHFSISRKYTFACCNC